MVLGGEELEIEELEMRGKVERRGKGGSKCAKWKSLIGRRVDRCKGKNDEEDNEREKKENQSKQKKKKKKT